MAKASKKGKAATKSEILAAIAEEAGLTKKQVQAVFDSMSGLIQKELTKGPEVFTVPGLIKIKVQHKPAQPARKGVPNPFRPGELMDVAAKPASKKVKATPLKALKDMVA